MFFIIPFICSAIFVGVFITMIISVIKGVRQHSKIEKGIMGSIQNTLSKVKESVDEKENPTYTFCAYCGSKIETNKNKCTGCGAKIQK